MWVKLAKCYRKSLCDLFIHFAALWCIVVMRECVKKEREKECESEKEWESELAGATVDALIGWAGQRSAAHTCHMPHARICNALMARVQKLACASSIHSYCTPPLSDVESAKARHCCKRPFNLIFYAFISFSVLFLTFPLWRFLCCNLSFLFIVRVSLYLLLLCFLFLFCAPDCINKKKFALESGNA